MGQHGGAPRQRTRHGLFARRAWRWEAATNPDRTQPVALVMAGAVFPKGARHGLLLLLGMVPHNLDRTRSVASLPRLDHLSVFGR